MGLLFIKALLCGPSVRTEQEDKHLNKLWIARHSCHLIDAGTYVVGPRPTLSAHTDVVGGIKSGRRRSHLRGSI
jgi:hypothetical protein